MEREELEKEYLKISKVADQRLRALEKYENLENFKTATKWAYASAMRDIKSWGGTNRFGTGKNAIKGLSDLELEMKIADINKFLQSKTSTKKGITSVYIQRANKFNEKYKTNVTWQEFAKFTHSDTYEKMDQQYGSSTIMEVFHKSRKLTKEEAEKIIKDGDKNEVAYAPEEREALEDLLKEGWLKSGKNNSAE